MKAPAHVHRKDCGGGRSRQPFGKRTTHGAQRHRDTLKPKLAGDDDLQRILACQGSRLAQLHLCRGDINQSVDLDM